MSTAITASEVTRDSEVWHDNNLCHITKAHPSLNGGVFIEWTENLFGREVYCQGSFQASAYFGEKTAL
jgi:hypothetical protein